MSRDTVKLLVGGSIIITHAIAFLGIVVFQSQYIPVAMDRLDVAMVLVPVSAGYVLAVIRSAVQNQSTTELARRVNGNYVFVVCLVTIGFCGALLYFVFSFPAVVGPTITELRRWLVVLEVAFGGGFGLIAEDLFGKIEKVIVPAEAAKGDAKPQPQ